MADPRAMAEVIPLPGAAPAPVMQTPRKGRLPRAIGKLWEARNRRYAAQMRDHEVAMKEQMEAGHVLNWIANEVRERRIETFAVVVIDAEDNERWGFFGGFDGDPLWAVHCLERAIEDRMERD
jgi:hypothetical protein